MIRRTFMLAAASLALASPALAGKLSLDEINAYFGEIFSARGAFQQVNDDGSRSSGTLYMVRPGRVRFEYKKPDRSLVIAGGGRVVVFDARSNEPPQKFQLQHTPLNLILSEKVDLRNKRMVVGHDFDGTYTRLKLQDPKHPEYGSIILFFEEGPRLRQWVTDDGSGARTIVGLASLTTGERIRSSLFDVDAELKKRGFD